MIERFRQEEIMSKVFNTTAVCIPEEHYMVNIAQRLQEIKALVDVGNTLQSIKRVSMERLRH